LHFQDSSRTGDDELIRPDMTVHMPAGRKIVVDAKVPLASFDAYIDASTDDERRAALVQHGQQTRRHVDELSRKEYWEKVAGSPDFVVMFLPNESFLYAALECQRDLMEYAMKKRVLIASPPSLIGLLKVINYGWMEQRLAEDAQKIAAEGREFHKRIVDFMTNFADLGKALSRANKLYHTAEYNLKSRVALSAKRLEELGARSSKDAPKLGVAALPAELVDPGPPEDADETIEGSGELDEHLPGVIP
jgi:DNA recombination protein RmuC